MILYGRSILARVFQRRGSVFGASFSIAAPCATITFVLKVLSDMGYIPFLGPPTSIFKDNGVWGGFSFLVGFLIVFRTSQAYSRFWDGCTAVLLMRAEWLHACSQIMSFCAHSTVEEKEKGLFQNMVVRLFSMLHALALAEIEDVNSDQLEEVAAFKYELLDVKSIDDETLKEIRMSDSKVELVCQWIQQFLVQNIDTHVLSIPAPLLSNAFQGITAGMMKFNDAIKISTVPIPFPYAQTCDVLLLMHYVTTPFVMSQWVSHPVWALIFAFIQVSILWSLNCIAVEIENPFGQDDNDLDSMKMQQEMNAQLMVLLQPAAKRLPRMHQSTVQTIMRGGSNRPRQLRLNSFCEAWSGLSQNNTPPSQSSVVDVAGVVRSARRSSRSSASSSQSSYRSGASAADGGRAVAGPLLPPVLEDAAAKTADSARRSGPTIQCCHMEVARPVGDLGLASEPELESGGPGSAPPSGSGEHDGQADRGARVEVRFVEDGRHRLAPPHLGLPRPWRPGDGAQSQAEGAGWGSSCWSGSHCGPRIEAAGLAYPGATAARRIEAASPACPSATGVGGARIEAAGPAYPGTAAVGGGGAEAQGPLQPSCPSRTAWWTLRGLSTKREARV